MIDLSLDDKIILDNDLDCAIQELDILFNTECTELLGNVQYGTNITPYLWTLTPATESLKTYLTDIIYRNTYYVKQYNPIVAVKHIYGNTQSMYLVSIILTDNISETITTRNYKLQ